jgi:hypothetical protein
MLPARSDETGFRLPNRDSNDALDAEAAAWIVGSAEYRWLRGGVPVNYHTLNDFRVANEAALDELLTQILTVLVSQKLVTVKRIAQDGTRVRASAGRKSFRGRDRLEELRDEMAAHVAEVKDPAAMKPSRREREAQARLSRIDQALETLKALEEAKAKQKNKPSKQNPPQASTTDPEARMMRMGDGGMRPGYNVQIAVDIQSRAERTKNRVGAKYGHLRPNSRAAGTFSITGRQPESAIR